MFLEATRPLTTSGWGDVTAFAKTRGSILLGRQDLLIAADADASGAPAFNDVIVVSNENAFLPVAELRRQVSCASLAVFRIGFGAIMVWHLAKLLWPHAWGTKLAFQYVDPAWLCPYVGFEWVRAWPEPFLTVHVWILLLAAAGIALGFCYRLCAPIFCGGFTYLFLLESADYNNHYYLICLIAFLLIWMPANQVWSVDAWRRNRKQARGGSLEHEIPFWRVFLLRSQLFVLYFYGGVAKFNADWLTGP